MNNQKYLFLTILLVLNQVCIILVNSNTINNDSDGPVVEIKQGKLKGSIRMDANGNDYYSFKGIPYGTPPVGNLRFKAPVPADSWTGIRDATSESNYCFHFDLNIQAPGGSEDCLYLNVYTQKLLNEEDLKPVMVWIHGGGFVGGSSTSLLYNPTYLITEDVVVVTLNYRLWILGFLSLEDTSLEVPGNAGLKDMVLALKWIQENIKKFNGDPDNVTIFGESAGSAAAHYLYLSQATKGLFHRAILQSGVAINQWATGRKNAIQVANALGNNAKNEKEALIFLQSISTEEIIKVYDLIPDQFFVNETRPFSPVVENPNPEALITEHPMNILLSGNYNQVPIIIGYTSREGMIKQNLQILLGQKIQYRPAYFEYEIPSIYNVEIGSKLSKTIAKQIEEFYYGPSRESEEDMDKFFVLYTDTYMFRGIHETVKITENTSNVPVYMYKFSAETKLNRMKPLLNITTPGVCHGEDLFYIFHPETLPYPDPDSIEDISIHRVVKLWTNFAKTGNPTPQDNKNSIIDFIWPTALSNEGHIKCLDIDKQLKVITNPEKERMQFWDNVEKTINANVKTM